MSISQAGLILDITAALILGFESWIKLRTIGEDSICVGHGSIAGSWKIPFFLGYPFLILGFILQYVGSA
jgi:hypothetical protein